MKVLATLMLLVALAIPATAAEVQIIVRADNGSVLVDTTITTDNATLQAIEDWRLLHAEEYATRAILFRRMMIDNAKRILRAQGSPAIQAERDKIEAAKAAEDAIIDSAIQ